MEAFLNFQADILKLLNHINVDCPKTERHEKLSETTQFRIYHMHGTLAFIQQQLMVDGSVNIRNSPFKTFLRNVDLLFSLLCQHRKLYRNCNIPEDEWNALVDQTIDHFNSIPDVIQNPLHQHITARGTPLRTPTRKQFTRRQLIFETPEPERLKRKVLHDSSDSEEFSHVDPNKSSDSSDIADEDIVCSKEDQDSYRESNFTNLRRQLLETDSERDRSSGRRSLVVERFMKDPKLGHKTCLLCGTSFTEKKSLYRHYRLKKPCRERVTENPKQLKTKKDKRLKTNTDSESQPEMDRMDLREARPSSRDSQSQLDQDLREAGPSRTFSLAAVRPLSREDSHSQLDQDLREAGPSRTFSLTALSSSEPNVPVPEPEREKRLEPEPEKRPEFSVPEARGVRVACSGGRIGSDMYVGLSVPNFIKQHTKDWQFGEPLPVKTVNIDTELPDISEDFLNRLNEAVGSSVCVAETDPKMKGSLKEFQEINYQSPSLPTGRIGLRDDYLFTWYLKPRILGHGKRKSEKTVLQYATYIFGTSEDNLYKYLEARNICCEHAIFPRSLRITKDVEAWAKTDNPSSSISRISAVISLYDYLWEKASVYNIDTDNIVLSNARQEFQRYLMLCRTNFSNSILDLRQAAKKSAKVAQELSEQLQPDRFEQVDKQIKDFFDGQKFLDIMKEIDDLEESLRFGFQLSSEKYNCLNVQLAFLTVLQNGQRAELANIIKRQDLFTQSRHAELEGMWTFQLNKFSAVEEGKTKAALFIMLSSQFTSALNKWSRISEQYLKSNHNLLIDKTSPLFLREDGNPLQMNNIYNLQGFKELGFSQDVRLKDSRKIQSTALDRALPAQDKDLHRIVHAHSAATVSQSYIINPTALFEKGTAYLHGGGAKVGDKLEEANLQFQENQRLLREHMQEVQEDKTSLSMSNRQRNSRQIITSKLRNSILYGILEMRDVVFTKRMLTKVPRNLCGRYKSSRYWDKCILGFLQDPSLADLVVKEITFHQTIQGFCSKVFSSLRAWNRTRVLKTSGGLASFLALTLEPRDMKIYREEETDETDQDEDVTEQGEDVIERDYETSSEREHETSDD